MAALESLHFSRRLVAGVLGLGFLAAFSVAPAPEGLSPAGMRTAGMTLLMATWWIGEVVPIAITALMPLVLIPILQIAASKTAAMPYGDRTLFLMLGGFFIAAAMERWNLHKRIALYIIRILGGGPSRVLLGFMAATALLSMWISNTATALMMLPIAMAVVSQAHSAREGVDDDSVRSVMGCALALGIAYSASIGGVGTPVGTPPNVIFLGLLKSLYPAAPEISFFDWMLVGVPLAIVFIPIAWVILAKHSFHLDDVQLTAGRDVIADQLKALGPMSLAERRVLKIFLLTALLWIFRKPIDVGAVHIPGWSELFPDPSLLHDSTVAIAMAALLFVLRGKSGGSEPLLDMPTARKVPWDVLLLIGGGYSLANAIRISGLAEWVAQHLAVLGAIPPFALLVIIVAAIIFMTEVITNSAISNLMLPILGVAAVGMGFSPLYLMVPATIAASCAFMLPSATAPNAIVFSSGHVTIPQMARAGLWLNMVAIIVVTALVYLIAIPVFGIMLDAVPAWAR